MPNQSQLAHQSATLPEQRANLVSTDHKVGVAIVEVATLRWAVGWFCAAVGALMLVVPHQFSSPSFSFVRPFLFWLGAVYLLAGSALLLTTVGGSGRRFRLLAHLACAGVLFFYAYALLRTATLAGGPLYMTLALGILTAGFIQATPASAEPERRGDLFAFLLGFCAVSLGLVMLLAPDQFTSPTYDPIRSQLSRFGIAYVLGGAALMIVHVWPPRSLLVFWLPHALVGLIFLVYMLLVSVPNRGITGVLFYGGFGALLIALPLVGPAIARFDASLLRVRLGMFFIIAAALPLTVTVALITAQQERIAVEQLLGGRQILAATLGHEIEDYVDLHRRAVVALAADPQLRSPALADQRAALLRMHTAFPEFFVCARFDARGNGVARSDTLPLTDLSGLPEFERVRSGAPAVALRVSQSISRPVLSFSAPVVGPDGAFVGAAMCGLEVIRVAARIEQIAASGQQEVYVVDQEGRAIATSDNAIPALTDLSASPTVTALRSGRQVGTLRYGEPPQEQLAGFASTSSLGWGVVVQRALADDLAPVRGARELAFWLLVAATFSAAAAGVVVAGYLTAPLNALAVAVSRFAAGDAGAPLPQEGVSEVARVAAAFDTMRRGLSAAATEREQAIAQRDTFFSVAAHELKTPLTALLGQAQLARRRAEREGELSEKNRRSLDVVVAQAQRLDALITALLDISRFQQGRLALEREGVDLLALVERVVEEIQPTTERHQLCCENATDGRRVLINGDALRLEQVLHNLISNAVKYSPDGGLVLVRVASDGTEARVSITDSGMGIPADSLSYLFERFYRAPNVDSRQVGGMGVGLFVVREIVTLHGGRVEVQSTEGQGSTFTVTLPILAA